MSTRMKSKFVCVFYIKNIMNNMSCTQVRFLRMETVLSVETQGNGNGLNNFVKSYRLNHSKDCVAFNEYIDNAGNNVVCLLVYNININYCYSCLTG